MRTLTQRLLAGAAMALALATNAKAGDPVSLLSEKPAALAEPADDVSWQQASRAPSRQAAKRLPCRRVPMASLPPRRRARPGGACRPLLLCRPEAG